MQNRLHDPARATDRSEVSQRVSFQPLVLERAQALQDERWKTYNWNTELLHHYNGVGHQAPTEVNRKW